MKNRKCYGNYKDMVKLKTCNDCELVKWCKDSGDIEPLRFSDRQKQIIKEILTPKGD
jgi:hypothetical protein